MTTTAHTAALEKALAILSAHCMECDKTANTTQTAEAWQARSDAWYACTAVQIALDNSKAA